jgi:hypothetical protein
MCIGPGYRRRILVPYQRYSGWCHLVLSSAKIGRSSWRYYQRTVAGGACEYYTERGDRPGRWYGTGLSALGLAPGAVVQDREPLGAERPERAW